MATENAHAAKWTITPSGSVEEEFTDNIGLRPDNDPARTSDFVTTVKPALSVRGNGGRVNLNGDYSFSHLMHMQSDVKDTSQNNLTANGVAELWEQSLFLDGAAQISQQTANTQGPISQSTANSNVNSLETTTWTIGPRFLHHFGTWAETTSTITRSAVSTSNNNNVSTAATPTTTATGSTPIGDSTTDRSRFLMKSGRRFTQVLWSVTGDSSKTSSKELPHHSDKLGRADVIYVVNRQLSLTGGGGLQTISDDSLLHSPNGPIWSIGANLRPGPRTTFNFAYNSQFDSKFFTYSGSYIISSRTSLSFSHNESIQTSSQLIAQNLAFVGVAPDGTLIDLRTLQPFNPALNPPGLQSDTLRQKTWIANFSSTIGRNRYNAALNRTESSVERTGQVTTSSGVILTYGRSLTPRLNGTASVNYQIADSTNGPVAPTTGTQTSTTNLLFSGSLAYSLAHNTSLNFTVRTSSFDAGDTTRNTHEKAASIALTRTF
jgi:uncharacterized protein (PEP-CTERM system associated)